jgi:hypothetical protein
LSLKKSLFLFVENSIAVNCDMFFFLKCILLYKFRNLCYKNEF